MYQLKIVPKRATLNIVISFNYNRTKLIRNECVFH